MCEDKPARAPTDQHVCGDKVPPTAPNARAHDRTPPIHSDQAATTTHHHHHQDDKPSPARQHGAQRGPATTALLSGEIAFMFAGLGHILPFSRSGKFRIIGVTDVVRHKDIPDVPTMEEAGSKGFDLPNIYHAIMGPLKMQPAVVAKFNQTARAALADAEVTKQLNFQGYDVTPSSPEELGALVRRNFDIWGRIVRTAKIEKM